MNQDKDNAAGAGAENEKTGDMVPDSAMSAAQDRDGGKKEVTPGEQILAPAMLLLGILFDRLVAADDNLFPPYFMAIFWIGYLIIFYAFNWSKLRDNILLWAVAGFSLLLCIWYFIFDSVSSYGMASLLVIPCVLMMHARMTAAELNLKKAGSIARAWISGWFVMPFSAIPRFFSALAPLFNLKNKKMVRIVTGILISAALLAVIIPLLGGADMMFGYYLRKINGSMDFQKIIMHAFIILIITLLFYSFFWNIKFREEKARETGKELRIDNITAGTVLAATALIYVLFCCVQFTYMFGLAGLPEGISYSEYAREGFFQLIAVSAINLVMFGVFLRYTDKNKFIRFMLIFLLALTGIMLSSGFVRLRLYIDEFGLTWLRLISAWFMIYLAFVIILSAVRIFKEKIPLIAVCFMALLCWYTALGYSNPDRIIVSYNISSAENPSEWAENNLDYLCGLSDDAIIVLFEEKIDISLLETIIFKRHDYGSVISFSSAKLDKLAEENMKLPEAE